MVELGVNIDHVATIREARRTVEPDPVWAAAAAQLGGADGITVHLREDRRHINDRDVEVLRKTVTCKLNLEMALSQEIVEIAVRTRPDQATLVPERRQEVTTEGGLDLSAAAGCREVVKRLRDAGVVVSAFLDADARQIDLARDMGFDAVELHTGQYANASVGGRAAELAKLIAAGRQIVAAGMRLHAGHGLTYLNVLPVAGIDQMHELNIGHAIISRSVFIGLQAAVREMKDLINKR
jgi:pyridoxine 5-phosphate synthase